MINKLKKVFIETWDILIDIPLPKLLVSFLKIKDDEEEVEDDSLTLMTFPVIGLIIGIIFALIANISSLFISLQALVIVFPLFVVISLEYLSSARNSCSILSFCDLCILGEDKKLALLKMNDELTEYQSPLTTTIGLLLFMFRFALFAILAYYDWSSWIIVALIANFSSQGMIARSVDLSTEEAFFELADEKKKYPIFATIATLFIAGIFSDIVTVFISGIIIYFTIKWIIRWTNGQYGGVTDKIISLSGYLIEILTLLLGIAFLIK